ncbi:hypothetical protein [Roseibium sp. RKSG952]|uniref:hypothetical protein n=1 Tax=Roseibium sp. RKSG952 TaxID=2529384 RepID=UPI0012BC7CCB|nr:hypothetical protein [Roseibium sp. RKSG952]MTH97232.1 hypothetical protein [Roseibium sp. RKSG952]
MASRPSSRSQRLALMLGVSLLVTPLEAFEPSGNPIADNFLNLFETNKGEVESYGGVSENGNRVTITDIQLTDRQNDDTSIQIGSTTLEDADLLDNGRLAIEQLDIADFALQSKEAQMTVSRLTATGVTLPSPEEARLGVEPDSFGPTYRSADLQALEFTDNDGNRFDIASITTSIDEMSGNLPTAGRFAINDLTINKNDLDAEGQKTLDDLGYDSLSISVSGSGKWDPSAATLEIDDLTISGEDAGTMTINVALGGITPEVVAELNEAQDDPGKAMGIVQGVTVDGLSIAFDNASLIERMLDKQANEAGTDRQAYVSKLTSALPMMLNVLQNQAFQAKVSSALTSFLANPQNLTVSVQPNAPVPVPQIMGSAMLAPQTLPQLLNVGVEANK